jgi:hypothetical protein
MKNRMPFRKLNRTSAHRTAMFRLVSLSTPACALWWCRAVHWRCDLRRCASVRHRRVAPPPRLGVRRSFLDTKLA